MNIHEGLIVLSPAADDVDRKSLSVEPSSSAHAMQVGVSIWWEIEVDDQVDSLYVDSAAEEISSDEEARAVGLEEVVVLDSFLLM